MEEKNLDTVTQGVEYESERLLVEAQEAVAEAIAASRLSRSSIASKIDRDRSFITQALSSGRNLTLKTLASIAWATGHRARIVLEPIANAAHRDIASSIGSAFVSRIADRMFSTRHMPSQHYIAAGGALGASFERLIEQTWNGTNPSLHGAVFPRSRRATDRPPSPEEDVATKNSLVA